MKKLEKYSSVGMYDGAKYSSKQLNDDTGRHAVVINAFCLIKNKFGKEKRENA